MYAIAQQMISMDGYGKKKKKNQQQLDFVPAQVFSVPK